MTYSPDVPAATQRISDTQAPIQTNFEFLQTGDESFLPESINLNNRTQIGPINNDPDTLANAFRLYCKEDANDNPELFGRTDAGDILQLTSGNTSDAVAGHTFLPGGLLLQWDKVVVTSGNTITFNEEFAIAPYFVTFIPTGTSTRNRIFFRLNGSPLAVSFSPIIITIDSGALTETIFYIALGRRM